MASWAADVFDVKPGLWNVTNTMQMSGLPPIPNLDQMTPEQRARIEGAMKNMAGAPHTTTVKSCITQEGIEKAIARSSSTQANSCAPKLVSMSASRVELHIDCTPQSGAMKSTGDVTIERGDSEHFTGTGKMKAAGSGGRTMDMKWSMTGTFVSSDCGDLKPAGQ
jgi:hypothetical protein